MAKGKGCLVAIGVIVVLGVASSMIGGNSNQNTSQDTQSTQSTQKQEQSTEQKTDNKVPEITVSAVDLSKAFHENELKAKDTYTGKIAEITGVVQSIDEMVGKKFIVLNGDTENPENIVSIQCFLAKDDAVVKKAMEVSKGSTITIVGKIGEKSINVGVHDCIIK